MRRSIRLTTSATLLALSLASSGCSLLLVDGPPDPPRPPVFKCTTGRAAPIIDAVIAGFEAIRTAVAIGADDSDFESFPWSRTTDIIIGAALTALFAGSSVHGYAEVSDCEAAMAESFGAPVAPLAPLPAGEPRVWAPAPVPDAPPPACSYDTQCKGDRICEDGRCVAPR